MAEGGEELGESNQSPVIRGDGGTKGSLINNFTFYDGDIE